MGGRSERMKGFMKYDVMKLTLLGILLLLHFI